MSECTNDEVRDRVPELAHGTIGSAERAAVEAHVAHCAACARELALVAQANEALRTGIAVDVAPIAAAVQRRTAMRGGARPKRAVLRAAPWALAAAAAIVLVAGGVRDAARPGAAAPADTTFSLDAELALASDAELEAVLAELDAIPATFGAEPEPALTLNIHSGETP